jgi:hypothetical protein
MGNHRGFIALMSVIIVGAILIVLIYTVGISIFFSRFNVLDTEDKHTSSALAEGCVREAQLLLAENSSYTPALGGECISLGGICGGSDTQRVCKICSIATSGTIATVLARATYNGAFTNLAVSFNTSRGNVAVTTWTESGSYAGPPCVVP